MPRPPSAATPGPGQVSVWDFPRPPRLEPVPDRVRVELGGVVVADSVRALRVCETASPPTYYIPREDIRADALEPAPGGSFCEWKGRAAYWTVRGGGRTAVGGAWSYPSPAAPFAALRDHVAFYAGPMEPAGSAPAASSRSPAGSMAGGSPRPGGTVQG